MIELMSTRGLKVGGGAPYFVTSVLDHPDFTPEHVQYMRYAGMGGSTVPAAERRGPIRCSGHCEGVRR